MLSMAEIYNESEPASNSTFVVAISIVVSVVAVIITVWVLKHYFNITPKSKNKNKNKNNNNNNIPDDNNQKNQKNQKINKQIDNKPTLLNNNQPQPPQPQPQLKPEPIQNNDNKNGFTITSSKVEEYSIKRGDQPATIITKKTTQIINIPSLWSQFSDGLSFGLFEEQGLRDHMENCTNISDLLFNKDKQASLNHFMLFDGHLGQDAAKFCTDNLSKYVEEILNKKQSQTSESTESVSATTTATTTTTQTPDPDPYSNNDDIIIESIREAFYMTDDKFKEYAFDNQCEAGAVGVYVYYNSDDRVMYVANVGDCRAILCTKGECKILTEEHNLDKNLNEKLRCKNYILNNRLNGELSITRAIGDYHHSNSNTNSNTTGSEYKHKKVDGLLCDPHIIKHKLNILDEFLIIACDGLWDVVNPITAMKDCRQNLRRNPDCNNAAKKLAKLAQARNTTDNVSVMVVGFANKDVSTGQLHIGPKREKRISRLRRRRRFPTRK